MSKLLFNPMRLAAAAGICLALAAPAAAQRAVSHQTLSVTVDQAVGLDSTTTAPSGDTVGACRVTVEGGSIRYWTDGTSPTTTSGHLMSAGAPFWLISYPEANLFRAIATHGASGVVLLQVSCFDGATTFPASADAALFAANTAGAAIIGRIIEGVDTSGTIRAIAVSPFGELLTKTRTNGLPLPRCNAVRTTNCQPKGF